MNGSGRRSVALLALVALGASGVALASNGKWVKDGTRNGVTVWTRDKDGSDVVEVKAATVVQAPLAEVQGFIEDDSRMKGIMPELKEMKSLGTCGDRCEYFYQRAGHPLLQDRHAVVKMRWETTEKDGRTIYRRWWNLSHDKKLPSCGAVPFAKLSGSWALQSRDDGQSTLVTYKNHTEIGGVIPADFTNTGVVKSTYGLLKKLRAEF